MRGYICILVTLLLLTACATGPTGEAVNKEKPVVKIGVIGPFSGDNAVLGMQMRDGVEFAAEHLDRTTYDYKLIFEDDQLDNTKTAAAYRKLSAVDGVDAVIGISSGSGNVIAPMAEADKVPTCVVGASDINVVKGRTYVFKHWVTPEAEGLRYAQEAGKLGWKRIVFLTANQQGLLAINDAATPALAKYGITIDKMVVDPESRDFRSELTRFKGEDVDAFMLLLFPAQMPIAIKELKELGFDQPITSIEMFEYMADGLDMLEGQWYITAQDAETGFAKEFAAENGEEPLIMTAIGYDCFNILVKGFEEGGNDPDAVMDVISQLHDYQGAGGVLTYNAGSLESPAAKKFVRNGEFVMG